jgi:hypothetical protein
MVDSSKRSFSTSPFNRRTIFDRERLNLDSYQLIWFGACSRIRIENLRKIIDYTKVFDNAHECRKYIEDTNNSTTTFLVCSTLVAEKIILQVECFESVKAIYVWDDNQKHPNQDLAKNYRKVSAIRYYAMEGNRK